MSLRERREVVALYRGWSAGAVGGVVFSVVGVAGSSYRQPGARMLVLPGGATAGTISGGCLEADLLRRAAWTVRSGAVIERFSTAFDDTAEIPYGLGCGGEIDLLAEPLGTPEAVALMEAMEATLKGTERVVVTLLPEPDATPARGLCRMVLDARGDVLFASDDLPTQTVVELRSLARSPQDRQRAVMRVSHPVGELFVERLAPVQRLIIFGGGEDARPLSRLAFEMGWQPVVVDTRAARASQERFPQAECMVCSTAAQVPVLPGDAAVLMTHSYQQDRDLMAELLPAPPRYLGLLGAKHRSALLLQEAAALAGVTRELAAEATHAPIGLELGGEGPEAISLAIVAEVQHALSGRLRSPAVVPRRLLLQEMERLVEEGPAPAAYSRCAIATLDEAALPTEPVAG